ncbi:1-(5-phosphoribosyl)-5-[(5-phosphoribosylamino)methylideneamino]imidazole-4-carboxamide isomerase [Clostridium vitabionis]|uniref:1-(5-phosphoribosyl)-5-[(5- phosphoribosylamino)methylideneamino]imidazole-4- carboxamide isomerase n=1 Tax=Clostridium vitabionis TaxID=2784388 RepID=UPI00188A3B5F|nr:1-(5-phosphoribosyl)-5-[(5-phosphoribosylamino)methylideneamino]imidazole-4-carboxamide isomerase [Clostridium vitabionis]
MVIIPAIDLYDQKVVRLLQGDYRKMTVYSEDPAEEARKIAACGTTDLHVVDLEGARDGKTSNFDAVAAIVRASGMAVEIGGGIRDLETIRRYLDAGVARVILGTKAVTDEAFLREALAEFGSAVEVGVDAKDGKVAVSGWTKVLDVDMLDFVRHLGELGVKHVICTDISRDGAMKGTNLALYRELKALGGPEITASGGISTYENIRALKDMGIYGAIVGKAMYTGDIDLKKAIAITGEQ